jgi:hypothetical protein
VTTGLRFFFLAQANFSGDDDKVVLNLD